MKLEGIVAQPYDLAVATARTCYSSKGIIRVEDVSATEKSRVLRDKIADSTRDAGHLTTRQHAHFVFSLDKVSRQFLWSFLHSHPYYNSEQVSQRYVKVSPGNYTVPQLKDAQRQKFKDTLDSQTRDYQQLIELSLPEIEKRYFQIFPFRLKQRDQHQVSLLKRAYEVARYVLGVATHAYLYHTVSALTLMRYHRLCDTFDVSAETRFVVKKMVEAVNAVDPLFAKEIKDPIPLETTPEFAILAAAAEQKKSHADFLREFDDSLGSSYSALIDYKVNAEATLASSVRSVLGLSRAHLSDDQAIEAVLNPKLNPYFSDTFNVNSLSKLSRVLYHAHYTFRKKISHTADSQDQRHRMVPGSRPILCAHYTGQPDFITPLVIRENAQLLDVYQNSMTRTFNAINDLIADGVAVDDALYLLPNAFPIRFEESGDLLNLHHKWKARSCYTAQEEIFFATIDELAAVAKVHPRIAQHILAPCYLRYHSGEKPYCPEGDRFCGVRVWQQDLAAYRNRIL